MPVAAASANAMASTVLILGTGAGTFASFGPSWYTVRSPSFHEYGTKDGNIRALRQAELAGGIATMFQGIAASWLSGSWLPTVGAAVISGVMLAGYEYAIWHPVSHNKLNDDNGSKMAGWSYRAAQ